MLKGFKRLLPVSGEERRALAQALEGLDGFKLILNPVLDIRRRALMRDEEAGGSDD